MRTIKREIVAAMIFSKDGKLLMVQKNPAGGGVYIDCWHIPGGGIDDSETKIQALLREVKEEVGLEVDANEVKLVDDEGKGKSEKTIKGTNEKVIVEMHFNVYKITIKDKTSDNINVILEDELIKYNWFSLDEFKNIKLTPPSVTLFTKLGYL